MTVLLHRLLDGQGKPIVGQEATVTPYDPAARPDRGAYQRTKYAVSVSDSDGWLRWALPPAVSGQGQPQYVVTGIGADPVLVAVPTTVSTATVTETRIGVLPGNLPSRPAGTEADLVTETELAQRLAGISASGIAASLPERLSDAALKASFGSLGQYELMTYWDLGDSWADTARSNYTPGASPPARLARQLGMNLLNRGASSRTVEDIANFILSGAWGWVPGSKALVTLTSCHLNNTKYLGTGSAAQRGYVLASRALLAALTSSWAVAANAADFVYSPGWSAETTQSYTTAPTGSSTPALGTVVSTGGVRFKTTTPASYALCAVTGPSADVFVVARTTGAGVVTVTDNNGGTVLGTLDLTATVAQETPAVLKLRGLGAGTRTLRITHTSGASLTVDSVRIPSTNPVPIVAVPAPDMPVDGNNSLPAGDPAGTYRTAQATLRGLFATVAAEYPSVSICPLDGFTNADFYSDKRHLNDRGAAKWAVVVRAHLASRDYTTGLNTLDVADPTAYVPPTPPTIPAGGQDGTGWDGAVYDLTANATYYWNADDLGADGSAVSTWTDRKSVLGLTQGTAASQPVVATVNGQKVVSFDGVDDTLVNTGMVRPAVETEVLVFRFSVAPTANRRYISSAISAAGESVRTAGALTALTNYVMSDGTSMSLSPAVVPDTAWHVAIFQRNGAASVMRIDNAESVGAVGGTGAFTGLRQAAAGTGSASNMTAVQIKRHYIVQGAPGAAQRAQIVSTLKAALPTLLP